MMGIQVFEQNRLEMATWKMATDPWWVSTMLEEEAGRGSPASCHSVWHTALGRDRSLAAFGGTVTYSLGKWDKLSHFCAINQLSLREYLEIRSTEALIPTACPSWGVKQRSLLKISED